jgi:dihydrofolate reductase
MRHEARQDSITKTGTIIYRVGSSAVRDDGEKLKVSRGVTQDGLQAALRMAMERYGDRITVNGSAEFKEQVAGAAAIGNLALTFEDVVLERRRQALLSEANTGGRDRQEQQEELVDNGPRPDVSRAGVASPSRVGDREAHREA